jgi:hypothetical protein
MSAAVRGFAVSGRGAIVVDTTQQALEGRGNPMAYLPQAAVERLGDDDLRRMVRQYDPTCEFVVELLKQERASKYRIQVPRLRR